MIEHWPEDTGVLEIDIQERPNFANPDWQYTLIEYRQIGDSVMPLYETGWGTRRVGPNQEIEVHETNNLRVNLLRAKEIREERRVNPTAPILGRDHDFFDKKGALEIFNTFEDHYPELHAKILDIYQRSLQPRKSIALYTERDIANSCAWEIIASIARALRPELDIKLLTV